MCSVQIEQKSYELRPREGFSVRTRRRAPVDPPKGGGSWPLGRAVPLPLIFMRCRKDLTGGLNSLLDT